MGADQHLDWALAKSALEWWRAAGVDVLVEDAPRDWLGTVPPATNLTESTTPFAPSEVEGRGLGAAPAARPSTSLGANGSTVGAPLDVKLPDTLADFLAWRASDAAPEAGWGSSLHAPEGPSDAKLMILIECPERDAPEALLGGPAGVLFDRMLAAIGLDRARVHLAALAWARPLAGRMPAESTARLAALARHHVDLVAPERLLLLGNAASRAVLGADVMPMRGSLQPLNHKIGQRETGVVASFALRFLLERPAAKAEAWRDLQLVMRGLA